MTYFLEKFSPFASSFVDSSCNPVKLQYTFIDLLRIVQLYTLKPLYDIYRTCERFFRQANIRFSYRVMLRASCRLYRVPDNIRVIGICMFS